MTQIFDGEEMYCYECGKDLGKTNPSAKEPYIHHGICEKCQTKMTQTFDDIFQEFIIKWCSSSAHLSYTDENDGQMIRDFVKDNYLNKQRVQDVMEEIKDSLVKSKEDELLFYSLRELYLKKR